MKLYNTMSQKKEEFSPIDPKEVRMYTCGPTVYWHQHVGNFRSMITPDVIKRVLDYNGFSVKHIINVTDVGHLTNDSDDGDDKIEEAAKKEGKTAKEISHFYFDAYLRDFKKLNLIEPKEFTWATDNIPEQIDLIKKLEEKGFAYITSDGVYFDTSKFEAYGKLSKKKISGLEGGKRVNLGEKKNKTDFALWKFSGVEVDRQQEWESPWGVGFPGWHVECSAMATKYLGEEFDIHTGGEDNMPVHHENEIAQSECGYGKSPWVKYWVHTAFLVIKGGKMGKSLGNIKRIEELEKDGISPLAYRYFTFSAHYRKPLTWSDDAMNTAVSSFNRLKGLVLALEGSNEEINEEYLKKFEDRINDDLDMPGALAVLWGLLRDDDATGKVKTVKRMDEVFGLDLFEKPEVEVPEAVKKLAEERESARAEKDFGKSDELRDEILKFGFVVKDSKGGYVLKKNL